ncbi:Hypothetical protein NTJ_07702 [Nesidiocoris tenuis]|uniref:Uncharacterized protein n=1 Tax=Nesidiocoris tenuis TaxID=355587 RepID=A0ABN7AS56_9HEMI|nr:Hypothetical protein NTJ_07702 [Nesidiocoris tenuis]
MRDVEGHGEQQRPVAIDKKEGGPGVAALLGLAAASGCLERASIRPTSNVSLRRGSAGPIPMRSAGSSWKPPVSRLRSASLNEGNPQDF